MALNFSTNRPAHPNVPQSTPAGLEALYSKCREVYPEQSNPLQVTAVVKYWLGGPDPLDYISMYANPGNAILDIPVHWHYVSFGLSDLHGDGRVHETSSICNGPSGFGFELTFRLKREPGETAPPTWPASVMQSLANYVFGSGNTLCAGDHVSWHCALDNSESRMQHMLMTTDPQLGTVSTPFGNVTFVQIIGITKEELQAAQHWNGPGVLEILKRLPGTGGEWLVTNMRRGESMQEIDPGVQDVVDRGIECDGSNLSGVTARCSWVEVESGADRVNREIIKEIDGERPNAELGVNNAPRISAQQSQQIRTELTRGLMNASTNPLTKIEAAIVKTENDDSESEKDLFDQQSISETNELLVTRYLDGLHLTFNLESGTLLPLAIRGRVKHGRHFTFKSALGDTAITFVASTVTGTFVKEDSPYAISGPWLQLYIPDSLAIDMAADLQILAQSPEELILPKCFSWPQHKLSITIMTD